MISLNDYLSRAQLWRGAPIMPAKNSPIARDPTPGELKIEQHEEFLNGIHFCVANCARSEMVRPRP